MLIGFQIWLMYISSYRSGCQHLGILQRKPRSPSLSSPQCGHHAVQCKRKFFAGQTRPCHDHCKLFFLRPIQLGNFKSFACILNCSNTICWSELEFTFSFESSFPAKASNSVVFPEAGGARSNVILKLSCIISHLLEAVWFMAPMN